MQCFTTKSSGCAKILRLSQMPVIFDINSENVFIVVW